MKNLTGPLAVMFLRQIRKEINAGRHDFTPAELEKIAQLEKENGL